MPKSAGMILTNDGIVNSTYGFKFRLMFKGISLNLYSIAPQPSAPRTGQNRSRGKLYRSPRNPT